jgi:hypothetical protein
VEREGGTVSSGRKRTEHRSRVIVSNDAGWSESLRFNSDTRDAALPCLRASWLALFGET